MLFPRLKVVCASSGRLKPGKELHIQHGTGIGETWFLLRKCMLSNMDFAAGEGGQAGLWRILDVTLQRKYFIYLSMHVGIAIVIYLFCLFLK